MNLSTLDIGLILTAVVVIAVIAGLWLFMQKRKSQRYVRSSAPNTIGPCWCMAQKRKQKPSWRTARSVLKS